MANQWTNVTLAARFNSQYIVSQLSGCWLWVGTVGKRGYGMIKDNYRTRLAHRVSYELKHGPIPSGQHVCHTCDVPNCVNPEHLFLGSATDNNRDKAAKGRAYRPIGSKHHGAKLTEADVLAIRASQKTQRELAEVFGVNRATISVVRSKKSWRHLG